MSVTVLVLVVFESQTKDPHFQKVESYLITMCFILIIDLLFFLFKSGNAQSDSEDNFANNSHRSSVAAAATKITSGLIYFTMISWLLYGNYIYFNLPPNLLEKWAKAEVDPEATPATVSEIDPNKWLYVSLMCVLTIGYLHLLCFFGIIVCLACFYGSKCLYNEEEHE